MTNLESMTLAQLIELHNQHAPKPVRAFRDRKTALARTRAVLPSDAPSMADRVITVAAGRTMSIPDMMEATGLSDQRVRAALGVARRRGYTVTSLGKRAFEVSAEAAR